MPSDPKTTTEDEGQKRMNDAVRELLKTPDVQERLKQPPPTKLEDLAAPSHTDLMVSPESIDAFLEANPYRFSCDACGDHGWLADLTGGGWVECPECHNPHGGTHP